jgi:dGTPase
MPPSFKPPRDLDAAGRFHAEPADPLRNPFEVDRHRIITCTAFRRLEGKTQVFLAGTHDHFRTRLTHSLEVAEIARTLARSVGAEETLVEAIALAHDLGHPPFGHAGETALNEAMAAIGGFNHNLHSLRVVEYLEHPYLAFRGLNLTGATRAGLRSHCTIYDRPDVYDNASPAEVSATRTVALQEAVVASIADRLAYALHDLEDALGAELISEADLEGLSLWRRAVESAGQAHASRSIHAVRRAVLDAILDAVLLDVSARCVGAGGNDRSAPALSERHESGWREVEEFLLRRVYRSAPVAAADAMGRRIIAELFSAYRADPRLLPDRFFARLNDQGPERVIGDYIAGMTDRFCEREHARCGGVPRPADQAPRRSSR